MTTVRTLLRMLHRIPTWILVLLMPIIIPLALPFAFVAIVVMVGYFLAEDIKDFAGRYGEGD